MTAQTTAHAPAANTYYVTTPIYYVNGSPHIGNAYPTIAADAIARYHRLTGKEVFFLTGTDEHGINNERAARDRGVTPQQHVDELAAAFQQLWHQLDISYDRFIRTTEDQHKRGVLAFWERLLASGDLYRATYEGAYCAGCEAYYQPEDLVDAGAAAAPTTTASGQTAKLCPIHRSPVEQLREQNYFFRLSRYAPQLERLIRDTDFVQPVSRRNEVLGFIQRGLRDFSVTRRNVHWGIPVPGHPDEVFYVWVDALTNYLTGIGYPNNEHSRSESAGVRGWGNTFWPADLHLVGKDIIRFHCLYWPALLLAAVLPLPRKVFAHGWLTRDGQKLSKSRGITIDPAELATRYGSDAVRYYCLRAIPFGQDGDYTETSFAARYTADLANDFGNLVQRATALIARYADGAIPTPGPATPAEQPLLAHAQALPQRVAAAFDRISPDGALEAIFAFVTAANRYAEETAPWQLAKQRREPQTRQRLDTALYHLAAAARLACWFLSSFIPRAATEGHRRLAGHDPLPTEGTFQALRPGTRVTAGPPLFPRSEPRIEPTNRGTDLAPAPRRPETAPSGATSTT